MAYSVQADQPLLIVNSDDRMQQLEASACLYEENTRPEDTLVHLAARSGDYNELERLIKQNPDYMTARGEHKDTILHAAIESGSYETVELVVKAARGDLTPELKIESLKEYMNMRNKYHEEKSNKYHCSTPLHFLPGHGSVKMASLLIDNGADVDPDKDENIKATCFNEYKKSPLHYAVNAGATDIALFLLKKGAFVYRFTFADIVKHRCKEIAKAVMRTDQWTVLRSNYQRRYTEEGIIEMKAHYDPKPKRRAKMTTPFRDLIVKMPDVAEAALDQCTLRQGHYAKCEEWETDVYTDQDRLSYGCGFDEVESWGEREESSRRKKIPPSKWGPRTFCKANHPLQIMIEHERMNLLTHPVVESLIYHKWIKFGLTYYFINLFTFILFLILLTTTALLVPNPRSSQCSSRDVNSTKSLIGCANSTAEPHNRVAIIVVSTLGLIMAAERLVQQLIRLVSHIQSFVVAHQYWNWNLPLVPPVLKEIIYWIQVSLYTLSIVFMVGIHTVECFCAEDWLWQVGVTAVFLGWIVMMHFVSTFPIIGIYVHVLKRILMTYLRMVLMTVLLIISFGLSFHMLFYDPNVVRSPFSPVLQSLVTTITMAAGEVNYEAVFRLDPTGASDGLMGIPYLVFSNILWILFLILIPVILLNMLTSLAIENTNKTLKEAWLKNLSFQVGHALEMEEFRYICVRFTRSIKLPHYREIIYPFQERKCKLFSFTKLWGGSHYQYKDPEVIHKVLSASKSEENMQEQVDSMERDMQQQSLEANLQERIGNMEREMQKILQSEANQQQRMGNMERDMQEMKILLQNLAVQLAQVNPKQSQEGDPRILTGNL